MTQSEAILEYIDGTLDHDAEQALFDSMARQPELRSTLRQFIGISAAVHADREAYAPPAHVERALLSGLGLAPGAAGAAATSGIPARFGARFGGMMVSFLLGLLLAGTTVFWLMRDADHDAAAGHAAGNPGIASTAQGGTAPGTGERQAGTAPGDMSAAGSPSRSLNGGPANGAAAPVASLRREDGLGGIVRRESATRSAAPWRSDLLGGSSDGMPPRSSDRSGRNGGRSVASAPLAPDSGGIADRTSTRNGDGVVTTADGATQPMIRAIDRARPLTMPLDPGTLAPREDGMMPSAPASIARSGSSPIEPGQPVEMERAFAELRGKLGSSLNPTNARNSSSNLTFINNMAAGAYLRLNPGFAVGLEGGAETYDQVLNFDTGDTDRVEQRPLYAWGGVAGRYYPGSIPGIGLVPFMQGTLGLTSAGPLGRLRLGGGYDLGGASLTLGVEASTLVYTFNGRPLMSGRWGATVGAEVKLW